MVANTWLEGSYTERYPNITRDAEGCCACSRSFRFQAGFQSRRPRNSRFHK